MHSFQKADGCDDMIGLKKVGSALGVDDHSDAIFLLDAIAKVENS